MRIMIPPDDAPMEEKIDWLMYVLKKKNKQISLLSKKEKEETLRQTKKWLKELAEKWGIDFDEILRNFRYEQIK